MSKYNIHQWNQTIDSSSTLRPIFTFSPDEHFLNYINTNPGPVSILIEGTDYYDGQQYATCLSTANFPTFGPNYFQSTEDYVMVVDTDFSLYPKTPGVFFISYDVRGGYPGSSCLKTVTLERFENENEGDLNEEYQDNDDPQKRACVNLGWYIICGVIALIILVIIVSIIYKCYVI